jgi:ribosomal-protein-alanine N-acetyltransferase
LTIQPTLKALIRPALLDDIPVMLALEREAGSASHWSRRQYEQVFAPLSASAEPMPGKQFRSCALTAQEEECVRGFLIARGLGDEWEIENIVVADLVRKRGLGTQLLRHLLGEARRQGAQAVFLEVRESNRAARALYQNCGFQEEGRRNGYYRDPTEDAILYTLSFP